MYEIFIWTSGDKNIRIGNIYSFETAQDILRRIIKIGGYWYEDSWFPYHAMRQFDIKRA